MVALVRELDPLDLLPGLGSLDWQRRVLRVTRERRLVRFGRVDRIGVVGILAVVEPEHGVSAVPPEQRFGALQPGLLRASRSPDRRAYPRGEVAAGVLTLLAIVAAHRAIWEPRPDSPLEPATPEGA